VDSSLHIAFIAAEALPYAKAGGLGDVAGALPRALAGRGHRVQLILPMHRVVRTGGHPFVAEQERRIPFQPAGAAGRYRAWTLPAADGLRVVAIEIARYFDRPGIYTDPATGKGFPDDGERFLAFGLAALDWLVAQGERIDVLHCNDYHCGVLPLLRDRHWGQQGALVGAATVFSIHNLAYQGLFPLPLLARAGLTPAEVGPGSPWEYWGQLNCMKAGILGADLVATVSPRYAQEIAAGPEFGHGLEGVLADRLDRLVGILNGIDPEAWSPAQDAWLPQIYTAETVTAGKAANKAALQAEAGLALRPELPLLGIVSRLVHQKGFDLFGAIGDALMALPLQLLVLGSGTPEIEAIFAALASRYPDKVRLVLAFDEALAHRIEAGADFFLMPSRYEPCGLNQLYSLRYGTLPIVRETGGLADTVSDLDRDPAGGRGFVFEEATPAALLAAIRRALRLYEQPAALLAVRRRIMGLDFSWERSAGDYLLLYAAARAAGRGEDGEVARLLARIRRSQARDSGSASALGP
jgi:starch synthase